MLRRVALVRTDSSEERSASIMKVSPPWNPQTSHNFDFQIQIYFKLQMRFYPLAVSLRQYNTRLHRGENII
jgi:hypothetical protein